ncbi:hypothetical protein ACLOJK_010387 [Asimina triloba]
MHARIQELPGLPAGVKFDPSDQELLEHLEGKVRGRDARNHHPLIDEFIPTLERDNGICYTHPEKLPGEIDRYSSIFKSDYVKIKLLVGSHKLTPGHEWVGEQVGVGKDGLARHFFHCPSKAYTTGTRKRRKVNTDEEGGETRWHKTGKTRAILIGGKVKGHKKILVLYTNYGRQRRPEKTNWVMHQYHLGSSEDEKDGELVVSKVFYQTQPRQCGSSAKEDPKGQDGKEHSLVDFYAMPVNIGYDQTMGDNRGSSPQLISHSFSAHEDGSSLLS